MGIAFLVFPVLLLVATLPTWVERTVDARDAAANAARTLAQAPSWTAGVTAANQVVDDIATNDGLNPSTVAVTYHGSLDRRDHRYRHRDRHHSRRTNTRHRLVRPVALHELVDPEVDSFRSGP